MAVISRRCFTVTCDVCGRAMRDWDDTFDVHFDTQADVLGAAEDGDWHASASGAAVCTEEDEAHLAAIRALHGDGIGDGHWCWVRGRDEDEEGDS